MDRIVHVHIGCGHIWVIREVTQQDGWKSQDGRMTTKRGARLCIPNLTRHLFVILLYSDTRDFKVGDYGLPTIGRETFGAGTRQRVLP